MNRTLLWDLLCKLRVVVGGLLVVIVLGLQREGEEESEESGVVE